MNLHIIHRTRYEYSRPVVESFNEARLRPLDTAGQLCESFLLKVLPTSRLRHYFDFHKNWVHVFEVPGPHTTLAIESISRVITSEEPLLGKEARPAAMSTLAECERSSMCYDFLQPSRFVEVSPEVWRLALDASHDSDDVWQTSQQIMHFVHREFAYQSNSTSVHTHMSDVLQERRGVCQDFAHVMIGMCRAVKIPARYVSGYLYNGPRDQLLGTQASHAWCEVWIPQLGWKALDPTNNQAVDHRYVHVAVGRDYGDVPPVSGSYRGGHTLSMAVEVEVREW